MEVVRLSEEIWMMVWDDLVQAVDTVSTRSLLSWRLVSTSWNRLVCEALVKSWHQTGGRRELCFSPPLMMTQAKEGLWFWSGVTTIMLECEKDHESEVEAVEVNRDDDDDDDDDGPRIKVGQYNFSKGLWTTWQNTVTSLILSCDCRSTPWTRGAWLETRYGAGEDGLALELLWNSVTLARQQRDWPCLLEAMTAWSKSTGQWRKLSRIRFNLSVDLKGDPDLGGGGGGGGGGDFPRVDKILSHLGTSACLEMVEINQCLRGELGQHRRRGRSWNHGLAEAETPSTRRLTASAAALDAPSALPATAPSALPATAPSASRGQHWSPEITRWVRAGAVADAVAEAGFLEKITNNRRLMQQLSRLPQVLLDGLVLAHSSSPYRPYRPLFEFEEEYLISYGVSQAWVSRHQHFIMGTGAGLEEVRSIELRVRPPPPGHIAACWLTNTYSLVCEDCHAMEHGGGHAGGQKTIAEGEAGMSIWLGERHYHWRQRCLQRQARSQLASFKLSSAAHGLATGSHPRHRLTSTQS